MPVLFNQAVQATAAGPAAARSSAPGGLARLAGPALPWAAVSWCVVAVLGQLMFAAYVIAFYGRAAVQGQPEVWNKVLPHGYVPGDTTGNLTVAMHLFFTVVAVMGGAMQLVPAVRRLVPAVHRWNGRLYIVCAVVLALGGLIMVWTRGAAGAFAQHVAISLNGLVIMACAAMAWRHARARRIDAHRRWALRLFLAVSGVWFFRIGLMAWLMINRAPVGFDPKTFQGPFLTFLGFAQFLLPLAVLEIYFRVRAQAGPYGRLAMAGALAGLTLLTGLGIAGASMLMWLPRF